MKIIKFLTLFCLVVLFTGCEDYFGENANVDPDNPTVATVNVLLPQVQARMAYTYGGDFTRYLGINTQHVDGLTRQFAVIGQYQITPGDVDNSWSNVYSGTLNSNKVMMNIADETGAAHYKGLGLVLESFTIMMATDAWGDIPYSDALNFGENGGVYAPALDSQQDIYETIFSNLSTAVDLLSGDNGGVAIGSDDLIYGGDPSKWIQFANALTARGKIHLSKVNGNAAYTDALAALGNSFGSIADAATFEFGTAVSENAPWYQYIEQRDDCELGAFYKGLLGSLNDPRDSTYGIDHTIPDHPIFTPDQNMPLLSYSEVEFMKAEAHMALGDKASSFEAFSNGVFASFTEATNFTGAAADSVLFTTYMNNNGYTEALLDMNAIMMQKYIALYTSPEVFNDWRRTGIPNLTPIAGTEIPRRLPYSQAEQFANENIPTPANSTIYDRVWWDQ